MREKRKFRRVYGLLIAFLITTINPTAGLFGQSHDHDHDQDEFHRCSTDELHAERMNDPEYAQAFVNKKMAVRDYLSERGEESRSDCDEIIFIPVAVHYQDLNIPMACAIEKAVDQVRILNEDFSATNEDIDRWEELNPEIWPGIANKESCIQFCLATLDHPASSGLAEGDFAVTVNQTTGQNNAEWVGYLNFYVRNLGGGLLGFAPLGGNGNGDGAVCNITAFSSVSCGGFDVSNQYGLGRTMTHEIGHYLLLEHPFGNDCATDNDGIADTPIKDEATFGCPYNPTNMDANEIVYCTAPALWPSYMDYVDDACMFMFSQGQVNVMEAYVETSLQNLKESAINKCQDALCVGFNAQINQQNETCTGNDASIGMDIGGGSEPFIFSIDGGISFQNNSFFGNLSEGDYDILVQDGNECLIERNVSITREVPPLSVVSRSNAFCGDNSGSVVVEVNHPDQFEFSISGSPGWRDTTLFTGLFPGTYTITTRNDGGCTNSVDVVIGDDTDLSFNVRRLNPVNCPLFDNGEIWVDLNTGVPPFSFTLNNDRTQEDDGRFSNLSTGLYTIRAEDGRGCRVTREFNVGVSFLEIADECPCDVFVPNAMTPNGDGLNDLLDIVPSCPISDFQLQIFDRWGGLVFESLDPDFRWNGGTNGYYVRHDIYFYKMTFRWGEVRNESLEVQIKSGYVQVLR